MASSNPTARYPFWLTAGIGAVVLLSLFIAFRSYQSADAYARAYQDPYRIGGQAERLRGAIPYLPEKAEIGYLSDVSFEVTNGSAAYFGVMYALAPRLVTRSADRHEWVVGNFSHPLDYAAAGASHHLSVVKDFGNGVVLFRRGAR